MTTNKITTAQETALINAVEMADLCSPEAVCDNVLAAGRESGYEAAIAALESAKANDADESKSLGL